jgi:hypothetical protein
MARGRKPKEQAIVPAVVDHAKALKQFEQEQRLQLEEYYKELAKIKYKVDHALTHIGFIDSCETVAEAGFKAGRAFGPLDEANDRLKEMLDDIFDNNDVNHWEDYIEEN